jgi:hypothetical protein
MLEVRERQRRFREDTERLRRDNPLERPAPDAIPDSTDEPGNPDAEQPTDAEEPTIPLTLEAVRAEIARVAGDNYEEYRRFATLIALLIEALNFSQFKIENLKLRIFQSRFSFPSEIIPRSIFTSSTLSLSPIFSKDTMRFLNTLLMMSTWLHGS